MWTSDNPSYNGDYVKFADVLFKPQPVQKPHTPIWIGGESKAALRRVARLGDGWFPAANNPKFTISNPKDLRQRLELLKIVCDEENRNFTDLDIGFFYTEAISSNERRNKDGDRQLLTGQPSDIAADISKFNDIGLGTLICIFQRPGLSETLEQMEWFGKEIIPLVREL